jgi:hypothetical protein
MAKTALQQPQQPQQQEMTQQPQQPQPATIMVRRNMEMTAQPPQQQQQQEMTQQQPQQQLVMTTMTRRMVTKRTEKDLMMNPTTDLAMAVKRVMAMAKTAVATGTAAVVVAAATTNKTI